MTEVRFVATCDAPLDFVFDYLDDYRNVPEYWHGMVSYRPAGEPDLNHGLGAMFEATSKIGPSTLKSTIRTVHWERNVRVAYKSVSGLDTATSFEFAAVDDTRTTVEFRVEFRLPGSILGRAMEKSLEFFVSAAGKATAENIAQRTSGRWLAHGAGSGRSTADVPD